ncbi:MAG: hypothetical protein O7D86_06380, partial [Proteobacteria bacterium]|nr:hypothetical protein [Pseudomonadota bacterium]
SRGGYPGLREKEKDQRRNSQHNGAAMPETRYFLLALSAGSSIGYGNHTPLPELIRQSRVVG